MYYPGVTFNINSFFTIDIAGGLLWFNYLTNGTYVTQSPPDDDGGTARKSGHILSSLIFSFYQ